VYGPACANSPAAPLHHLQQIKIPQWMRICTVDISSPDFAST
jgi:hypothetical protein